MKVLPFIPLLALVAACSNDLDHPAPAPQEQGEKITLTANLPGDDPQTRIGFNDPDVGEVKLTWSADDQFLAYSPFVEGTEPTTKLFTLTGNGGSANGSFTGELPVAQGLEFNIFYPSDNFTKDPNNNNVLTATTIGQTQTGNNSTAHLSDYNLMTSSITDITKPFQFYHRTMLMRFDATLKDYDAATDGAPIKLTLAYSRAPQGNEPTFQHALGINNQSYNCRQPGSADLLLNDVTLGTDNKLRAYLTLIGSKLRVPAKNPLVVSVTCASGTVYRYEAPETSEDVLYQSGQRYRATCELTKVAAAPNTVLDNNTRAAASFSGYGVSASQPYFINTASDLKKLVDEYATYVNNYFQLTADLRVEADEWTPIGVDFSKPFRGKFDGNGHTISGKLTGSAKFFGFFGIIGSGSEVRNLHITAEVNSTFQSNASSDYYSVGGIAGQIASICKVFGCTNSGTVSAAATQNKGGGSVGGITGYLNNNLENCINRGKVIGKLNIYDNLMTSTSVIGGIAGTFCGGSSGDSFTLLNCRNYGEVTIDKNGTNKKFVYLGGIVGEGEFMSRAGSVVDCTNYGTIKAVGSDVTGNSGGLVAWIKSTSSSSSFTMHNCVNRGTVEASTDSNGDQQSGGMIGRVQYDKNDGATFIIADCCTDTGSGLDWLCGIATNSYGTPFDYTLPECTDGHIRRDNNKPFTKAK